MKVESLDKNKHDRKNFDCGEVALNNYLKTIAAQHESKSLSRTFVLISGSEQKQIKGYYSLSPCLVELNQLPENMAKKYPKPIHCALIGRLAVSKSQQGQGFGSILLVDAIRKAVSSSEKIPTPMIIVESKGDSATKFYLKMGFQLFPRENKKLFMSLKTAQNLIANVDDTTV